MELVAEITHWVPAMKLLSLALAAIFVAFGIAKFARYEQDAVKTLVAGHPILRFGRLCCTNRVRDSSRESSVIAGPHEQTDTPDLQDPELASLQRGAQAPGLADDLVRSCHDLGCRADRQARPPARLQ